MSDISTRQFSPLDELVNHFDQGLRTLFGRPRASRPSPAAGVVEQDDFSTEARRLSAALMRVNHCGEVCAQALYQGQAITARTDELRENMRLAADEEIDHLDWCQTRLDELDSHTSRLNPLWYSGSLALGLAAGLLGDKWNLGFLAETERQVVTHLEGHLQRLPKADRKSRAIVDQMRRDEAKHATMAVTEGAAELPVPIRRLMRSAARIMTTIAAKI